MSFHSRFPFRTASTGALAALAALAVLSPTLAAQEGGSPLRYPDVGANRIRVEHHMLPPVTTGPIHPRWSPDGRWVAFSMRGDIWKVPAEGGEAVALTRGPAYHFEPAWSPDGQFLALSLDLDGNLDVGVVPADGGEVLRVTTDPHVDVQPEWSPDGRRLFFASARSGSFDVYGVTLGGGDPRPVVEGRGHQVQPAVSPDGTRLAYLGPVEGRLGTGGIWVVPLAGGEPRLVRYEETSYRTRPRWRPDGGALFYVSDEAGSNDLVAVPAAGGTPARLTGDPGGEFEPDPSPDGARLVFASNRSGGSALYTVPAGGARSEDWTPLPVTSRRPVAATGRVRVRVEDPDGEPLPARVYVEASDGRAYTPDDAFHRVISATETHYFHVGGPFEVELPAGPATLQALHGFDRMPASASVDVPAGGTADLTLTLGPLDPAPPSGWVSGETHAHDLHQGRYGLDHIAFFGQLWAEDLRVTNALIHMDGTRIMGRWSDLTGTPHPLSTSTHILQYAQEFRGSFGHVGLLGISRFEMPLIGGTPWTAFSQDVLNRPYLEAARDQGGIGGFMHPFTRPIESPEDAADNEIPLDVALGSGDFFDVLSIWYDALVNAGMYYRLLNVGARLAATAGSDNFADVYRDPPPGTDRTYARVEGPLTVDAWLDAVRAGRTFATNGPLVFLAVDGREPGSEIQVDGVPRPHRVRVDVSSMVPLDRVEVIANGQVAASFEVEGDNVDEPLEASVDLPDGGWIAARAIGPSHRWVADSYAFAQTTPVYVVRDGRPWRSVEDARFLAGAVEAMWDRARRRDTWTTPEARAAFEADVRAAISRYRVIEADARARSRP